MSIPFICSITYSASAVATINALGGRGVSTTDVADARSDWQLADVIHLDASLDSARLTAWLPFLTTYKDNNPQGRLVYTLPASWDVTTLQLITLSDVVIVEPHSLTTLRQSTLAAAGTQLIADLRPISDAMLLQDEMFTQDPALLRAVLQQCAAMTNTAVIYSATFLLGSSGTAVCLDSYVDADNEFMLSSPQPSVVMAPASTMLDRTMLAKPMSDSARAAERTASLAFATAFCTVLAQDYPPEDALVVACAYRNQLHRHGRCLGWPRQRQDFPQVVGANSELGVQLGLKARPGFVSGFAPSDTLQLGLYPVVDSLDWVAKVLAEGVKTVQLRIKDKPVAAVAREIKAAVALARQYQARLFINDYWQLAIEYGAYGVHLGQQDMQTADFLAIRQAGLQLGLSTHGYYEILSAHAMQPSYIALGHVFPTVTKVMPSKPQGLIRLQRYVELMRDYPLVAIGGISVALAPEVVATGVGSIAVVTAITRSADYPQTIGEFNEVLAQVGIGAQPIATVASTASQVEREYE